MCIRDRSKLNKFAEDKTVLKRLNEIKLDNKKNFAAYLEKSTGQVLSLIHISARTAPGTSSPCGR